MEYPVELKYTEEHEWVLIEEDTVTVGITDFAQDAAGGCGLYRAAGSRTLRQCR